MTMSDEEILREAGRIRARQRVRLVKTCVSCGASFVGIAQARYCSAACRMRAARDRQRSAAAEPIDKADMPAPARPAQRDDAAFTATMERLRRFRARTLERFGPSTVDAVEVVRRARDDHAGPTAAR